MNLKAPIYFSTGLTEKANHYYKLFITWTNQKIRKTFVQRNMFEFKHIKAFDRAFADNPGPMVRLRPGVAGCTWPACAHCSQAGPPRLGCRHQRWGPHVCLGLPGSLPVGLPWEGHTRGAEKRVEGGAWPSSWAGRAWATCLPRWPFCRLCLPRRACCTLASPFRSSGSGQGTRRTW